MTQIQQWHPLDRANTEPQPPTPATKARRRVLSFILCSGALNATSWRMADRMARALGCSCEAVGVAMPDDGHAE